MDIATALGIIFGFVVIIGTIMHEGDLAIFFNIPALCIVGGGMTCATLIHFSMKQVLSIFSVVKKTFVTKIPSQMELIQRMVNYAAINRRDGALALEQEIQNIRDPFFCQGFTDAC